MQTSTCLNTILETGHRSVEPFSIVETARSICGLRKNIGMDDPAAENQSLCHPRILIVLLINRAQQEFFLKTCNF